MLNSISGITQLLQQLPFATSAMNSILSSNSTSYNNSNTTGWNLTRRNISKTISFIGLCLWSDYPRLEITAVKLTAVGLSVYKNNKTYSVSQTIPFPSPIFSTFLANVSGQSVQATQQCLHCLPEHNEYFPLPNSYQRLGRTFSSEYEVYSYRSELKVRL